jgi:hypothetical protein
LLFLDALIVVEHPQHAAGGLGHSPVARVRYVSATLDDVAKVWVRLDGRAGRGLGVVVDDDDLVASVAGAAVAQRGQQLASMSGRR